MPRKKGGKGGKGGNVGGAFGAGKGQGKDKQGGGTGEQPANVKKADALECPICHQKGHGPEQCPRQQIETAESSQAESSKKSGEDLKGGDISGAAPVLQGSEASTKRANEGENVEGNLGRLNLGGGQQQSEKEGQSTEQPDQSASAPKDKSTRTKKTAEERHQDSMRAVKELETSMAVVEKRPTNPRPPSNFGRRELFANYFPIRRKPNIQLYQYKVIFDPDPKNALATKYMIKRLIEGPRFQSYKIATDYATILVTKGSLLDGGQEDLSGVLPAEHPTAFKPQGDTNWTISQIAFHDVDEILTKATSKEAMLQALNLVITRKPAADFDNVAVVKGKKGVGGNKFFDLREKRHYLDNYLSAYRGFYGSVRSPSDDLLLNINAVAAAFVTPMLVYELEKCSPNDRTGVEEFAKRVKGLRVEYTHPPVPSYTKQSKETTVRRLFRKVVRQLAGWPDNEMGLTAQQAEFDWDHDGQTHTVTVEDYFRKRYNKKLHAPDYQLVDMGTAERQNLYPPELLAIRPGQIYRKKLEGDAIRNMIDFACVKPCKVAESLTENALRLFGLESPDGPAFFGLKIVPQFIRVKSRILQPPNVHYRDRALAKFDPKKRSWNLWNRLVYERATLERWKVIAIDANHASVKSGVENLQLQFRDLGLVQSKPDPIVHLSLAQSNEPQRLNQIIDEVRKHKSKQVTFILWVLSDTVAKNNLYSMIKYAGDFRFGIPNSCVISGKGKFGDSSAQYYGNVAIKINLKLRGLNHALPPEEKALDMLHLGDTMIVGIDVTHPPPGSASDVPSVASVVASYDKYYAQYPASIKLNPTRQEQVNLLREMMEERLATYREHNNNKMPKNILVYRDGVGESQYEMVLKQEGAAIAAAAASNNNRDTNPKISIVVVGKRHHTRFFDSDNQGYCNPQPGTIVDTDVTMKHGFDFFLQPHFPLKGTAKPTHYVVLQNGMNLEIDSLEKITHNLCFLWQRATNPLSIVPAVQAADLACERARLFMRHGFRGQITEQTSAEDRASKWVEGVHPDVRNSMFYM